MRFGSVQTWSIWSPPSAPRTRRAVSRASSSSGDVEVGLSDIGRNAMIFIAHYTEAPSLGPRSRRHAASTSARSCRRDSVSRFSMTDSRLIRSCLQSSQTSSGSSSGGPISSRVTTFRQMSQIFTDTGPAPAGQVSCLVSKRCCLGSTSRFSIPPSRRSRFRKQSSQSSMDRSLGRGGCTLATLSLLILWIFMPDCSRVAPAFPAPQ